MAHVLSLPAELQFKIFELVSLDTQQDKRHLAALSLTTRRFTRVAQDLMLTELNSWTQSPWQVKRLGKLQEALSRASAAGSEEGNGGRTARFVSVVTLDCGQEHEDLLRRAAHSFVHINKLEVMLFGDKTLPLDAFANLRSVETLRVILTPCDDMDILARAGETEIDTSDASNALATLETATTQQAPFPFAYSRLEVMSRSPKPSIPLLERLIVSAAPRTITSLSLDMFAAVDPAGGRYDRLHAMLTGLAPGLLSLSISGDARALSRPSPLPRFNASRESIPGEQNFEPFLAKCSELKHLRLHVKELLVAPGTWGSWSRGSSRTAGLCQVGDRGIYRALTYLPPSCKLRSLTTAREYARHLGVQSRGVPPDKISSWKDEADAALAARAEQTGDMATWIEPGAIPALDELKLWRVESSSLEALEAAAKPQNDDSEGMAGFLRHCRERGVQVKDSRVYFEDVAY